MRPRPRAWLLAALLLGAAAPCAQAAPGLETIVQDDALLLHRPAGEVDASMAALSRIGVDRVRLTADWSAIAPGARSTVKPEGFDAADPGDYGAGFDPVDRAVRAAAAHGLAVNIDIGFYAPHWAAGDSGDGRAVVRPDAGHYGDFARAVAARYSGSFAPLVRVSRPSNRRGRPPIVTLEPGPVLPAVTMFTLWNEPNISGFIEPQWERDGAGSWVPASPRIYRELVRSGYAAVKSASPSATVLIGGLASGGAQEGPSGSVAALRFLRELACVDDGFQALHRSGCMGFSTLPGDGLALHPYSLTTRPGDPSPKPDHARIGDLGEVTRVLAQLTAAGRLAPAMRNVWITEYGYETNEPVKTKRWSLSDQARFLPWAEYLAWREPGVRSFAQFLLRDIGTQDALRTPAGERAHGSWQTGLLFEDGRPKPALASFAASLFAQTRVPAKRGRRKGRALGKRKATTLVWAHLRTARGPAPVQIQRSTPGGGWEPVAAAATNAHGELAVRVPERRGAVYRVVARGGDGRWRSGPAQAPARVRGR